MSSHIDIEKGDCCTSETNNDDGNETVSVDSRNRSYSGEPWFEPPGGNFSSSGPDHPTTRDQGRGPRPSPLQFRASIDDLEERRTISASHGSRQSSQESNDNVSAAGVTENGQLPWTGSDKVWGLLDPEDPGEWVLRYHIPKLISRLKKPPISRFIGYFMYALRAKLAYVWYRRTEILSSPSQPLPYSSSPPGDRDKDWDKTRFRIDFAELQRMRIRKLQCQLVRYVVQMRLDDTESEGWEQALEQYIKAIQDYDYIETRSKSTRDPFLVTGEYRVDNYVLKCYIDREIAKRITSYADSLKSWDGHNKPNSPISVARLKDGFLKLFMAAAAGGAFLIGPMWLMVLDGGLYTSLITTSAFVTVFGLWMAYLLPKMDEVLGSTAAYAAVLIVFVGTSS